MLSSPCVALENQLPEETAEFANMTHKYTAPRSAQGTSHPEENLMEMSFRHFFGGLSDV